MFDASYGTQGDYASGTFSAHPDDRPFVPSRTAAEQAAIDAEREMRRIEEQRRLAATPEAKALCESLKDALRDRNGHVIPRNDGAYRYDAAEEPFVPEVRPLTPADGKRYLGTSIESLMGCETSSPSDKVVYLTRSLRPKEGHQFIGRARSSRSSSGSVGHQAPRAHSPRSDEERMNQYG